MDLSRIETAAAGEEQAPVKLAVLVREAVEIYASRAEQANLSFTTSLSDDGPTVLGSEAQLRQALANLLDNAIKFTPEGGEVTLSVSQESSWVTLQVEDTGIGIPDDDIARLFGRFRRGRNTASYEGSGLGLAIVKAIVEGHGGNVLAESTGSGAKFSLRLPMS